MSDLPLKGRGLDLEFVNELEIQDQQVYPLPGGTIKRGSQLIMDPRINVADAKSSDAFVLYEHVATVKNRRTGSMYVAFRETKVAKYLQQQDPVKYPVWVMESAGKDLERMLYIHRVTTLPQTLRLGVQASTWVDKWLQELDNVQEYESLAYFLMKQGVVNQQFEAANGQEVRSH